MKRFRRTFEQIWQAFSGEAAWQTVADLSRFHRIQASPGYRQAAQLLHRRLVGDGLDAEILSFSADERTAFWACPSFQEWDSAGATLHLVAPAEEAGLLADFRACPISLIQRSAPFDGEAEVVLLELDAGEGEADYDGPDVAGKVVLSRGDLRRVWELAVAQRGAVGILFDGMRAVKPVRPEGDLADPEEERQAAGLVPTRRVRGPISIQDHLRHLGDEDRAAWNRLLQARQDWPHHTLLTLALYWADGARSVLDIADRVQWESGKRDVELLLTYFRLLEKLGFVAFQ